MSRESRFRGRHIDTGEWVYGYLIGNDVIVGDIVEFDDEYFNTEFWYKVDPETVGQYIGRPDDKGNELYEGQRVKFTNLALGRFSKEERWEEGVIAYSQEDSGFYIEQVKGIGWILRYSSVVVLGEGEEQTPV